MSWQVTPPADIPANVDMLTATASYFGLGSWSQTTEVARAQVTVQSQLG